MIPLCSRFDSVLFTPKMSAIASCSNFSRSPCVLRLDEMPSSDASGDWMRRMGANESGGLAGLQRVNRCVFRRLLRDDERADFTLDIDATQIVAEKREARYSYKGEKGYMPMVGHIAEKSL